MAIMTNTEPSFAGRKGVWAIYSHDTTRQITTPQPSYITHDPIDLLIRLADVGYGTGIFWPYGIEFSEAIKWWEAERIKYGTNSATISTPAMRDSPSLVPHKE